MDARTRSAGWEQLYSLQQEYEGVCRKAWALRGDADAQRQAELDREMTAVMRRVEEVFRRESVPGIYQ